MYSPGLSRSTLTQIAILAKRSKTDKLVDQKKNAQRLGFRVGVKSRLFVDSTHFWPLNAAMIVSGPGANSFLLVHLKGICVLLCTWLMLLNRFSRDLIVRVIRVGLLDS